MATSAEIGTRALRRLGVIDPLESPSAEDLQAADEALTAMVASWEAAHLTGDTLPLDGRFEQGIVAMLAVRMAEEYGKTPGPVLLRDAEHGWAAIQGAFFVVPESAFESSLASSSLIASQGLITQEPEDYAAWEASTAYPLRAMIENGNNLYEVVTAGTSGSTGPTGTGPSITDGTVTWCWRRVLGR